MIMDILLSIVIFVTTIFFAVCVVYLFIILPISIICILIKNKIEDKKTKKEEEKRKSCIVKFEDEVSEKEFQDIAYSAISQVDREIRISFNSAVVLGYVYSQSGLSVWNFKIDFNDYGKITGKYLLENENKDSDIPKVIAYRMSTMIQDLIKSKREQRKSLELKTE